MTIAGHRHEHRGFVAQGALTPVALAPN